MTSRPQGSQAPEPTEFRNAPAQPFRAVEFDLLSAAIPNPIMVVAADNRIVYANPAAEQFTGLGFPMLRRLKLEELVAFGSPLVGLVDQVRRTGSSLNEYSLAFSMPRVEGPRIVDVYMAPFTATESDQRVLVMIQQRAMAQMIERQFTHRLAARSVSGMASVLAHEIKNPLSGIRGAAQLLEPGLPDQDRALTRLICDETDRIRALVDRMEAFGDERPLITSPVNIHDVLDHVRRLAISGFARRIKVVEDYDPSLPHVLGNRDALVQAMLNLVKNAAEAIEESSDHRGGRIILRTKYRPGMRLAVPGGSSRLALPLVIEIEDNGAGIPDELRPHLFDPFVTTKSQGSGLGLALVAKIIRDHGGIVECESGDGRTVFRVLLPRDEPTRAKSEARSKG